MPLPDPLDFRRADHAIEPLFLKRWSPRAMSGAAVAEADLMRLLEAARWAPSTYNVQEWRFLYARRETQSWEPFFALLVEANQSWCRRAGVLILVASESAFPADGAPNPVHTFDAGLAAQNLLLQAAAMGLVAHAMAGFDRAAAPARLGLPAGLVPEAMIAVGHPGDPSHLSDKQRTMEMQPSGRKPLDAIVCEGVWRG